MIDIEVQTQLIAQLDKLPLPKQQRVLEYARSLGEPVRGTPGKDFLALSGILDPVSAQEMMQAIEEGCEQVELLSGLSDPDGSNSSPLVTDSL